MGLGSIKWKFNDKWEKKMGLYKIKNNINIKS